MCRKLKPRLTDRESETTWTVWSSLGSNFWGPPAGSPDRVGATLGVGVAVAGNGTSGRAVVAAIADPGVGPRAGGLNGDVGSGVNPAAAVGRGAIVRGEMVSRGGVSVANGAWVATTADMADAAGGGSVGSASVGAGWAEQPAKTRSNVGSRANAGRHEFPITEIPFGPRDTLRTSPNITGTPTHSIDVTTFDLERDVINGQGKRRRLDSDGRICYSESDGESQRPGYYCTVL